MVVAVRRYVHRHLWCKWLHWHVSVLKMFRHPQFLSAGMNYARNVLLQQCVAERENCVLQKFSPAARYVDPRGAPAVHFTRVGSCKSISELHQCYIPKMCDIRIFLAQCMRGLMKT